MINRRQLVALAATSALAPAVIRPVFAQAWPTRPVYVVVPYAPGGSTDVVARVTAERLSRIWGQQVVIENKPGAGTNFGSEVAAKSDPDGYTVLMGTSALASSRNLYRSLHYAISDLAPVTLVCIISLIDAGAELVASEIGRGIHHIRQGEQGQGHICVPWRRHHTAFGG
jgi:tripartite-type tricarboxylate transporter receptor subunit TctC